MFYELRIRLEADSDDTAQEYFEELLDCAADIETDAEVSATPILKLEEQDVQSRH